MKKRLFLAALLAGVVLVPLGAAEAQTRERQSAAPARERQTSSAGRERQTPSAARDEFAWLVPPLPADNLVKNPWFRSGSKPSMDNWVGDGHWGATSKQGNPTPDDVEGTCARISTGRTDQERGKTVDVGVETCLYQVIAADPAKKTLMFDMYWVTHTVNPVVVTVYGGSSPDGPWTRAWEPFRQVQTNSVMPTSGSRRGQDLWKDYSAKTDLATTTLPSGFPYYKLEIRATLPDKQGGLKLTGVYFTVAEAAAAKPPAATSGR